MGSTNILIFYDQCMHNFREFYKNKLFFFKYPFKEHIKLSFPMLPKKNTNFEQCFIGCLIILFIIFYIYGFKSSFKNCFQNFVKKIYNYTIKTNVGILRLVGNA